MPIKIGTTDLSDLKLGSTQVQKVYQGSNLVWSGAFNPLDLFQPGDEGFYFESASKDWAINQDGTGGPPGEGDTVRWINNLAPTSFSPSDALSNNWKAFDVGTATPHWRHDTASQNAAPYISTGVGFDPTNFTVLCGGVATTSETNSAVLGAQIKQGASNFISVGFDGANHKTNNFTNGPNSIATSRGINQFQSVAMVRRGGGLTIERWANGVQLADRTFTAGVPNSVAELNLPSGGRETNRNQVMFVIDRDLSSQELIDLMNYLDGIYL